MAESKKLSDDGFAGDGPAVSASEPSSSPPVGDPDVLKYTLYPLLVGVVFGIALQTSRVHEFFFIRNQMLLRNFVMLKMFLAAAAVSTAIISSFSTTDAGADSARTHRTRVLSGYMTHKLGRGLPALILGEITCLIKSRLAGPSSERRVIRLMF